MRAGDYVAAAQSLPWVQQAGTTFRWTGSWLTVLTSADPAGSEEPTIAQLESLTDLLDRRRLAGYESYVLPPRYVSIDLQITVCAQPAYFGSDVEAAVLARLQPGPLPGGTVGFFDHSRWGFGEPLESSALLAAIQSCPGVDGVSPGPVPRARRPAGLGAAARDAHVRRRPDPARRQRPEPAGGGLAAGDRGGIEMSNGTDPACPCTAAQDPQVVSNPPGLPAISYRVDDFTGFRRALLRPLAGEQAIGAWRPAPGDLGLQVLEWWAYLADMLTFYNERIANESYLRTAQLPGSVANLVALLGYAPAPGIAATGNVAAMRTAGHPAEPLVIPAGMRCPAPPPRVSRRRPSRSTRRPASPGRRTCRSRSRRTPRSSVNADGTPVRPARGPGQRRQGRRPARAGRQQVRGHGRRQLVAGHRDGR